MTRRLRLVLSCVCLAIAGSLSATEQALPTKTLEDCIAIALA